MSLRRLIVFAGIALLGWAQVYPFVHQLFHTVEMDWHFAGSVRHKHADHFHGTAHHHDSAHHHGAAEHRMPGLDESANRPEWNSWHIDAHDCPLCMVMPASRYVARSADWPFGYAFRSTQQIAFHPLAIQAEQSGLPPARAPPGIAV